MNSEHDHAPINRPLLTIPFMIFSVLAAVAAILLVQRFTMGLGAVSNLNNGYPWGIWVVIDVVIGTAFGCGGFAMALLVYILNKGEYHPIMRPALLAGLFGYTLGGMAVIFDLGRYWQMYNIFLPGYAQPNSVMFEVALCVTLYIMVLWIEFSPAFMEKFKWHGARRIIKSLMFIFVAFGVLLPTMHQSSLGTMLVILGFQLDPLWQTQLLPLLFLISAITMGYSIVVWEGLLASAAFNRRFETELLGKVGKIMFFLLVGFLVLRFGDLIIRGALGGIEGTKGMSFVLESLLFVMPAVMLASDKGRFQPRTLFLASFSMLLAGCLYRLNGYLIGYDPGHGWTYFPSVPEMLITIGIFSFEVVLYLIFVKKLPVLEKLPLPKKSSV